MQKDISNEKSIETPTLTIKGNIMSWEGMMIQLSNVSCISTSNISLLPFPTLSLVILLGGLFLLFGKVFLIALLCFTIGICWIYAWFQENEKRKSRTNLNIVMNSGNYLSFIIGNKKFLERMLYVLKQVIINGGIEKKSSISFNINNCNISGNAQLLNDLNINN